MEMGHVSPSGSEIPIIDLSKLDGNYEDVSRDAFRTVAEDFGKAMSGIGFSYVVNHGVDLGNIEKLYKAAEIFFRQPAEYKGKFGKSDPKNRFHGYSGPGEEKLNEVQNNSTELKELFDCWGFEQYDATKFPEEMKMEVWDIVRPSSSNLVKKILRMMGIYLTLDDEEFFLKNHSHLDNWKTVRTQSQFRILNYYPINPLDTSIPPNAIRLGEHSDWGTITLLYQDDVGGLEVKRADGSWVPATPVSGAILVNSAQLMELYTSGIFHAAPHRVRIIDNDRTRNMTRQSFLHFISPDGDELVEPIPNLKPREPMSRTNIELLAKAPIHAYDHYKRLIGAMLITKKRIRNVVLILDK